jgi:aminoglycoside phosphotransferase (APT) family kinase protein
VTATVADTHGIYMQARQAVQRLELRSDAPDELELLEASWKSTVLRATWRYPSRWSVVLKRCNPGSAEIEAAVHAEVLPRLPVRAPRLYGSWREAALTTWLAVEDIGDEPPDLEDEGQRALVSRWLGELHRSSREATGLPPLPGRGAPHYLARIERANALLAERRSAAADPEDVRRLTRALEVCDSLLGRWTDVERAASQLPAAFVHADLATENLRLVRSAGDLAVTAIDWEKAGMGTPFADLSIANLGEYARAAEAPLDVIKSSVWVARLLRTLSHDWASKPTSKLGKRRRRLERDLAAIP